LRSSPPSYGESLFSSGERADTVDGPERRTGRTDGKREAYYGGCMVIGLLKKRMGFGTLGIVLGVVVVIVSIVWVTFISFTREDRTGNDVTWVG